MHPPVAIKILRVFFAKLREKILASTIPLNKKSPNSLVFLETKGKNNTRINRHASKIMLFLRRRSGGILRCSQCIEKIAPGLR